MVSRSLVLGYHGCDLSTAQGLVSGTLHPDLKRNKTDWLGHGFYFWEDSPARALRWARDEQRRNPAKIASPAVVGAVVDLGNCLNLIDAEHLEVVAAAHLIYRQLCASSGAQPLTNKGKEMAARFLDCAVFETLHEFRRNQREVAFDSVRAFFVEGQEIYPTAGLRSLDHIQICVRSLVQIRGFFFPRPRP